VREHDGAQSQPDKKLRRAIVRPQEFLEHFPRPPFPKPKVTEPMSLAGLFISRLCKEGQSKFLGRARNPKETGSL
jgi:hypothetical protein